MAWAKLAVAVVIAAVPLSGCARANRDAMPVARSSTTQVRRAARDVAALKTVQLFCCVNGATTAEFGAAHLQVGKAISDDSGEPGTMHMVGLAFPAFTGPAHCLAQVHLVIPAVTATAEAAVAVYASAATSLANGELPPSGSGGPSTLLDNRPRGSAIVSPGQSDLIIDVTEIVRRWAAGAGFPSKGRSVAPGTPVVLLLRPPAQDAGHYSVGIDTAPVLKVTDSATC